MITKKQADLSKCRAERPLELVHVDLAGPFQTPSQGGNVYFMVIIDDCSRRGTVYLLKEKAQAASAFQHFCETEGGADKAVQVHIVRSDNTKELTQGEMG